MATDQRPTVDEQRRSDRKAPDNSVTVFDALTHERIGQIGNLSAEGMMLIAKTHIEQGSLFQLKFTLDDLNEEQHDFNVGALCLWCLPASSPNTFWAGFEIMDIAEGDATVLSDIVVTL